MFGWRKKREPQGAEQGAGQLAVLLAGYPPFTPRHRGLNIAVRGLDGPVLTLEQARENGAQYRAAIPERIDLLRPVLAGIGVNIDLAYRDPAAYVTALHCALLEELPPLYRPETAAPMSRELSSRAGADIVLSFLGDLAMLECDVLMRAKPGSFVGLNLDPADRAMASYRRPCLLGLRDRLYASPPEALHVEAEYVGAYARMDQPARLAPADVDLAPGTAPAVLLNAIGGTLLMRLDRFETHPDLVILKAETWLGQA